MSLSCAIGPLLELAAGPASTLTVTATALAASALAALARAPVESGAQSLVWCSPVPNAVLSEPAALFDAHTHAVLGATQRTFRALSAHCKSAESWLAFADQLAVRLAAFSPATHSLALLVFAVPAFILHAAGPVRDKGLALVRAIATAAPADALSLLPLLVNQLSRETVPSVRRTCRQAERALTLRLRSSWRACRRSHRSQATVPVPPLCTAPCVRCWKAPSWRPSRCASLSSTHSAHAPGVPLLTPRLP